MVVALLGIASSVAAQDLTWRKDVQPIIQASCAMCHGANAPTYEEWNLDREKWTKQNVGPRMDTYEYFMRHVIWPATGSQMRRLDDGKNAGGKPGNMHMHLGSTDAERARNLQTIKNWLGGDAAWFLNRWEARGSVPGVTKEQLDKIKAKY
jgi:hypothetical protein